MKVAITAQDPRLEGPVDPRFGRARYFLLVNTTTGETTSHDNETNLGRGHGAGIQSAQDVASLGAEAVVTGNIGPKALQALDAGGIAVFVGAMGTVQDALDALEAGNLKRATEATVPGHQN